MQFRFSYLFDPHKANGYPPSLSLYIYIYISVCNVCVCTKFIQSKSEQLAIGNHFFQSNQ